MNTIKILFCILIINVQIDAQAVSKNILVEHFTNTRCSVCASRNPGFYAAKKQKPDVLHIAYHPSSPYSNCLFNTQNKVENDARTNHYGLYGGTPTFCINGDIKSSNAVQNSTVYTPYENQTSPISVDVKISPSGSDSIRVLVEVKAVSTHSLGNLSLYVPIIEDTVFYNAPNGEKQHYDVFRKSFTGVNAISFNAPVVGGSSFIYAAKILKNPLWNSKRLSAVAIVSAMDKSVIQTAQSDLYSDAVLNSLNENIKNDVQLTLYPNPSLNNLNIRVDESFIGESYFIYNLLGNVIKKEVIYLIDTVIDLSDFPVGIYIVKAGFEPNVISRSFSKIK